ncbi:MAG TPA: PTS sugar transporter subunit IIC, partial [Erysipelotrichaceae bacterium]|nr:PTS sugar transporter subunit IIC [Erysipelotrichaceae bacterium]
MQITLVQGILLALACIVIGVDYWLEAFFIFRPIIVATITGLILGDLKLGLIAGGLTELAFAGLTPAGGTQPPNPILAGVMTVVIAYTTNTSPALAIGLALPFSILMQYVILFFYSSFSMFMAKA